MRFSRRLGFALLSCLSGAARLHAGARLKWVCVRVQSAGDKSPRADEAIRFIQNRGIVAEGMTDDQGDFCAEIARAPTLAVAAGSGAWRPAAGVILPSDFKRELIVIGQERARPFACTLSDPRGFLDRFPATTFRIIQLGDDLTFHSLPSGALRIAPKNDWRPPLPEAAPVHGKVTLDYYPELIAREAKLKFVFIGPADRVLIGMRTGEPQMMEYVFSLSPDEFTNRCSLRLPAPAQEPFSIRAGCPDGKKPDPGVPVWVEEGAYTATSKPLEFMYGKLDGSGDGEFFLPAMPARPARVVHGVGSCMTNYVLQSLPEQSATRINLAQEYCRERPELRSTAQPLACSDMARPEKVILGTGKPYEVPIDIPGLTCEQREEYLQLLEGLPTAGDLWKP